MYLVKPWTRYLVDQSISVSPFPFPLCIPPKKFEGLRSWRPGTGPRNGNSDKVPAQVLGKMRVLARVLVGWALWEHRDNTACQHLRQHSGQHRHSFQSPRQHFSGIPVSGSCTRSAGSQLKGDQGTAHCVYLPDPLSQDGGSRYIANSC